MISGVDLFGTSQRIDLAEFGAEFSQFTTSAVRLEMLPRYHMESELGSLADFLAGKPVDASSNSGWHDTIRAARDRGAAMLRIRGLPELTTPYLRFELAAYTASEKAGEEFRFFRNDEIEGAAGADAALPDFWLFDESRAYPILYDTRGGVLGVVKADDSGTAALCALVDKLKSIPSRSLAWASEHYGHLRG
jgi:hypothetical protein